MCLIVPSRVVAVRQQEAEIELPSGQRARVDLTLAPEVRVGDYVLVDRGLVLRRIDQAEAETILAMYAELSELELA
jgi:hydrogenase expression/formation protein HypC